MNQLSKIEEENLNLSDIRINGEEIWMFLRVRYYFYFLGKKQKWKSGKRGNIKKKLHYLSTLFYGFKNWFKKYDYIIFSDSSQRKLIDGQYQDKLAEYLSKELEGESLFVELPNLHHENIKEISSRHIVSRIPLITVVNLLMFFLPKYKHGRVDEIQSRYNIEAGYSKWLQEFFGGIKVYKLFFRIYRPKAVVVSNYYYNIDVVIAAKKYGIKVIETQHGVIGESHFAFNINQEFSRRYFPDIMLMFGDDDKEVIDEGGKVLSPYSVGHYYLDYINNKYDLSEKWLGRLSKFKLSIAVSLQLESGKEILDFIAKIAAKRSEYIFLIAMRQDFQRNLIENIPDNVIFPDDLDCYQIVKHCDIHSSVYSTCVQESLALGKYNVLINLDNAASKYYSKLNYTSIVSDKILDDYISALDTYEAVSPEIIQNSMKSYVEPNYMGNIKELVKAGVFN
ncbi:MAG: hypothetical protein ABFR62_05370 [Bacteroidota bacterium]